MKKQSYSHPKHRVQILMVAFVLVCLLAALEAIGHAQNLLGRASITGNVFVDYTTGEKQLNSLAVGGVDESAYGAPNVLVNDTVQQQKLKDLHIPYMRINLKYKTPGVPSSGIVCGALDCDTRWSGDEWVTQIKTLGAEPVVEDPTNPSDLPSLVQHFNVDTNNPVHRWLGGRNEPNWSAPTQSATDYSNAFNATYDAMKAVKSTVPIKVGGPTLAFWDDQWLRTFLTISGSRLDFLDFHGYGQDGSSATDYPTLFSKTVGYEDHIAKTLKAIHEIEPNRESQIEVEVGEYDLNCCGHALQYTTLETVWGASAIGHIIHAGGIGMLYADKGNLLLEKGSEIPGGQVDSTTPMYHALGMYTGESLFTGFGKFLAVASTTLPGIEVFASDTPKNIVLINTDPAVAQSATIVLNGMTSGSAQEWRIDQSTPIMSPPSNIGALPIVNSSITLNLKPFSVTTLVITGATIVPTATPQMSPTPSPFITPTPTPNPSIHPTPTASPVISPTPSPTNHPTPTPIVTPPPTHNPPTTFACIGDGVYVYKDSNYSGDCTKFVADEPSMGVTLVGNDSASSVRIVGPYSVTLYSDVNYQGDTATTTVDIPHLRDTAVGNDSLSSLRVQSLDGRSNQAVTGFVLYNADTKQPIAQYNPLNDGTVITLSSLPTLHLNIRAVTNPTTVGSVQFGFDGTTNFHTESYNDYFLEGKTGGFWNATIGTHTVTAIPYTGSAATGDKGIGGIVTFTIR